MRHMDTIAAQVLRDAVKARVVDTVLSNLRDLPIPAGMFDIFNRPDPKIVSKNPARLELLEYPDALRYVEHSYPARVHDTITEYFCVELARVAVPHGSVGYIRRLEQVLNDADGNYYPSNVSYWGSPRFVDSDVDNCRWWLKIQPYWGTLPPRFALTSTTPFGIGRLPGAPYSELHEIDALWYPAGCKSMPDLIIPQGSLLRFYFFSPPTTTWQWEARGRLCVSRQSTYSAMAAVNTRGL